MEDITDGAEPLARIKEKLSGWRAGPNPLIDTPDENGRVAGFWLGVWHGFTAPVSAIRSLFRKDVQVFEVHNSGNGYVFGFLLGIMLWAGGGGAPRRRR
jgi:hypothetical protein